MHIPPPCRPVFQTFVRYYVTYDALHSEVLLLLVEHIMLRGSYVHVVQITVDAGELSFILYVCVCVIYE